MPCGCTSRLAKSRRNLEPACREHELGGARLEAASLQRAHRRAAHPLSLFLEIQGSDVRMQQDAHIARLAQPPAVARAEIGRAAEALDRVGGEIRAGKAFDHRPRRRVEGLARRVFEFPGFAQSIGVGIIRREIRRTDRPAAVGQVIACFEVDGIEGHAAPAPDRGGAAETALPVAIGRAVQPRIGDGSGVQILSRPLGSCAPGLEDEHFAPIADEAQRHGDARGARADDADIGVKRRAVRQVVGVQNHAANPAAHGGTDRSVGNMRPITWGMRLSIR